MPPDDSPKPPRFAVARGPLGIIGLFIALIYAMAVVSATAGLWRVSDAPIAPLIWFLVTFPVLVLAVFTWLVVRHTDKLYAPSEYGDHKPSWMKPDGSGTGSGIPKKRRAPRKPKSKPGADSPAKEEAS